MTEVHRYKAVQLISEGGAWIGYDPHGPNVVMEAVYEELRAQLAGALVLAEKLRDSVPGLQRQHLRELLVQLDQASDRVAPSASPELSAPVERDERAAFEAQISYPPLLARTRNGNYSYKAVESEWKGWQARAALDT